MPDRQKAALAIEAFLSALGRDPEKEPELKGTGKRVADAFVDELCAGYDVDVPALLAKNIIAQKHSEKDESSAVVVRDIHLSTTCPHHLMPAIGKATLAFEPNGKIVGVGTLVELLHAYAWRLSLQEQIAEDVVAALFLALAPKWAAVKIVLSHGCMSARGKREHGAVVEAVRIKGDRSSLDEIHRLLGVNS